MTATTSRPIRIVIVISNLEYGGAQRQVVELASHMDADSFDVHVCSLSTYTPLALQSALPRERLHVVHKHARFDATVVPRLASLLRHLRADVVHGYLFDANIAARLAGRLARRPVVINSERNTDYTLRPQQRIAYRLTHRCVDLWVANSHAGATFNQKLLGHPPERYRVVHNGVDTTRFRPGDGRQIRAQIGLAPDAPVVGMFASFKAQKNHAAFFRAAAQIAAQDSHTRFLLVGDMLFGGMHGSDEYCRAINNLVDRQGLRPRCIFLGNRDDVASLYSACDVTVLPSLFEGTANALLESMACRVPVVASDVSDNRYIVPEGTVGYVVPVEDVDALADRITRLLRDPSTRQAMGRAAQEWVLREFSVPRMLEKTADVYTSCLQQFSQSKHRR